MKAVILAAGKSTRTYPLTVNRPKVLLRILNKPILQHNLEALYGLVDEVILVVGFMKEAVMEHFGPDFRGMKLTYIEQGKQLGTGHATLCAKHFAGDRFILMNGDDIYHRENMRACLKYRLAVLGSRVKDPSRFGVWITGHDGKIQGFSEKPKKFVSDMANCGLYVLTSEIFDELELLKKSERGEYELNEALNVLAKRTDAYCVEAEYHWLPIGYPWSVLEANHVLLSEYRQSFILGEVEPNVTIKGNVYIGPGTIVKSGTYMEGPVYIGRDCRIGPNAYIRPDTVIEDSCEIRAETVDSLIMRNTKAKHCSYIGHSVIGENANVAGGTLTTDYRHDGKTHETIVNGSRIDTGRAKLGAFLGDDVKTGAGTIIYPGRKIWPGLSTLPGEIVKEDKIDLSRRDKL
jgi:UDP-N-acetylglucosamine diphosphorylase/glucosamine-1-phosphate N-acetyltransferase